MLDEEEKEAQGFQVVRPNLLYLINENGEESQEEPNSSRMSRLSETRIAYSKWYVKAKERGGENAKTPCVGQIESKTAKHFSSTAKGEDEEQLKRTNSNNSM